MTDTEVIAYLARELAKSQERCARYLEDIEEAHGYFVCIGGPLNDNKLGFNKEQLKYLQKICHALEVG